MKLFYVRKTKEKVVSFVSEYMEVMERVNKDYESIREMVSGVKGLIEDIVRKDCESKLKRYRDLEIEKLIGDLDDGQLILDKVDDIERIVLKLIEEMIKMFTDIEEEVIKIQELGNRILEVHDSPLGYSKIKEVLIVFYWKKLYFNQNVHHLLNQLKILVMIVFLLNIIHIIEIMIISQ